MKLMHHRQIVALLVLALLGGCALQPASSTDVTREFWSAVIDNDQERMLRYTAKDTLRDPRLLSNKDGMLKRVEVGAAQEQDGRAQVATTLIGEDKGKETRLPIATRLVREGGEWKVHGQESVDALVAATTNLMVNQLSGNLSALSEGLSRSISGGVQSFIQALNQELPQLKQQLNALSDEQKSQELGAQLGQLFAQGIKEAMKELSKGMDELNKELQKAPSFDTQPQGASPASKPAEQRI